jgi:uncharacterized coiled-coil protein SlyX
MDAESLVSMLGVFLGGTGLGTITNFVLARRKLAAEQKAAEVNQPIEHYDGLVTRLEQRIDKLETDHSRCMEEHSKAQYRVGELHGMVTEQRETMKGLLAAVQAHTTALTATQPSTTIHVQPPAKEALHDGKQEIA